MKIGICGGTFDPFHRGHLEPILAVRARLEWDRVLFMPAYRQPFKQEQEFAAASHRFAMAAMVTLDHEGFHVSDIELERGAVSYTVDTLELLREQYVDDTLDWIIGDDNLATLLEWKSIDRILALANFTVLTRSGLASVPPVLHALVTESHKRSTRGCLVFAENTTVPVSSTEIRKRVQAAEPIDELVDPRVSRYIHHYGLYRKANRERID
jgi:nicotinate-nucleotide adenylyltransferase